MKNNSIFMPWLVMKQLHSPPITLGFADPLINDRISLSLTAPHRGRVLHGCKGLPSGSAWVCPRDAKAACPGGTRVGRRCGFPGSFPALFPRRASPPTHRHPIPDRLFLVPSSRTESPAPGRTPLELVYLALPSVELSILRVAERVAHGGHSVPLPILRRRFPRSFRQLLETYAPVVDQATCNMNDGVSPQLVFFQTGLERSIVNPTLYRHLLELSR